MSISILLVEDHKIVREGTRQLLEQSADMQVVGEASDGLEAVNLAGEIQPDVIVMDVRLPAQWDRSHTDHHQPVSKNKSPDPFGL